MSEFDKFALSYNSHLNQSLRISGEDYTYLAEQRIQKLHLHLKKAGKGNIESLLDFGCGTGNFYKFAKEYFRDLKYLGVDTSIESIKIAQSRNARLLFKTIDEYEPDNSFKCAYCNGVFHHIDPLERIDALRYIHNSLKNDGIFSFWENNPLNIGTRYIMHKNPFDKNANLVSYLEAVKLLKSVGFKIKSIDFHFYFPSKLNKLRILEFLLRKVPLGAQYQILASK